MCFTKALFTKNDIHWTTKLTLTSRRCQYFAKKTHILTINKRETGRDIEKNKIVLKPT